MDGPVTLDFFINHNVTCQTFDKNDNIKATDRPSMGLSDVPMHYDLFCLRKQLGIILTVTSTGKSQAKHAKLTQFDYNILF